MKRSTIAVDSRTKKTQMSPMGISFPAMVIFGGTFHPRSPLYLKPRTSMARALKVKDQMTAERGGPAQCDNAAMPSR